MSVNPESTEKLNQLKRQFYHEKLSQAAKDTPIDSTSTPLIPLKQKSIAPQKSTSYGWTGSGQVSIERLTQGQAYIEKVIPRRGDSPKPETIVILDRTLSVGTAAFIPNETRDAFLAQLMIGRRLIVFSEIPKIDQLGIIREDIVQAVAESQGMIYLSQQALRKLMTP